MQHKYKLNEKIAFIKPDDGYKEKNTMETKNGSNKKPYLRKASQAPCV